MTVLCLSSHRLFVLINFFYGDDVELFVTLTETCTDLRSVEPPQTRIHQQFRTFYKCAKLSMRPDSRTSSCQGFKTTKLYQTEPETKHNLTLDTRYSEILIAAVYPEFKRGWEGVGGGVGVRVGGGSRVV